MDNILSKGPQIKHVVTGQLDRHQMYWLKSKNGHTIHSLRRRFGTQNWQYASGNTSVHTFWRDISELHARERLIAYNFDVSTL